jgi:hypothetical protein
LWREIRPEGTHFSAAQTCGPAHRPRRRTSSANPFAALLPASHRPGNFGLDLTDL